MTPSEPFKAQPNTGGDPWKVLIALPLVTALGLVSVAGLLLWTLLRPKPQPKQMSLPPYQLTALGRHTSTGGLVKLAVGSGTSGDNGVVERWFVTEGSPIRKGQLLARMNSWNQLQAALQEAEAKLRSDRSQLPNLVIRTSRHKELFRDGAISRVEFGKTEAGLEGKRAMILAGEATVQRVRQQLSDADVRSPLDGTLIRIYSWPGMKQTDWGLAVMGRTVGAM
ncbi:MAG: biotin/lipoyl-binding protein [Prochlorococcaceae cyanobacterium]